MSTQSYTTYPAEDINVLAVKHYKSRRRHQCISRRQ